MPKGYSIHAALKKCNGCGKEGVMASRTHYIYKDGMRYYCGYYRVVK